MPTPSTAYLAESAAYGDPPATPVSSKGESPEGHSQVADAGDTPDDYIPGLYELGSTYDVLNGKYADSKSTIQQVIDWSKSDVRVQSFGNRQYSVPAVVNFTRNTTSDYRSSYGKSTSEYSKSLSVSAGFEADFPGFSASASADYSESQRENLSNSFTRVTYSVTHYNLSLPPASQIRNNLKLWFAEDLNNMEPLEFYKIYGTHLLRSLTMGGRALFLTSTDSRSYSSEMSLEAAAKVSASYAVASGKVELSTKQKKAMESFNESSETAIVTKGGDPKYGNQEFLQNAENWASSILDYPEFVDFGSNSSFVGLWDLASTPERRDDLLKAYPTFLRLHSRDLSLPGPYIHARTSNNFDEKKQAYMTTSPGFHIKIKFPPNRTDGWYLISPGTDCGRDLCVIAKELVPGALAPVKWAEVYVASCYWGQVTRFWKAIPPTKDYIALGFVALTAPKVEDLPAQPPATLVDQFRAVHKRALTGAVRGTPDDWVFRNGADTNRMVFAVDYRYWLADLEVLRREDSFVLDPKMSVKDWTGW